MENLTKEQSIVRSMKNLDVTREEAEELYAYDNDEIDNEEVIAIEQKVADRGVKEQGRSSLEKVKHMKAKKKGDANKEAIIDSAFSSTVACEHVHAPVVMSATKMSFMDKDGNYYTIAITKHKSIPAGYDPENAVQLEELPAVEEVLAELDNNITTIERVITKEN